MLNNCMITLLDDIGKFLLSLLIIVILCCVYNIGVIKFKIK